jgi:hypothetical protein
MAMTPSERVSMLAAAKGCSTEDVTVCVLERPRHEDMIAELRSTGASIRLITDGIPATIPDGQGQASTVSLTSAERIEVLTGPLAQLYGNSAGGVIQTTTREAGTPQWLPTARNAQVFRFVTANDKTQLAAEGWGPVRVLYLQYPSDPIVFFEEDMWHRKPDWMGPPRAADVSPGLTWMPAISFIQLIFDMMTATTVPKGRGHVYAAADYARGWQALTGPQGIGDDEMLGRELTQDAVAAGWVDEVVPVDGAEALLVEGKHFVECIKTGKASASDGEFGFRMVELIEAATASMRGRGETIHLPKSK